MTCPARHHRPWSALENRRLTEAWGDATVEELAQRFNRTAYALFRHATVTLKLPTGCPQGMEFLSASARRCGFTVPQLRAILAAGKQSPRPAMVKPTAQRKTRWIVDPVIVDAAVARWMQRESVRGAAVRRGIDPNLLRRALVAAGHKPPRPGRTWRLPTDKIDAVASKLKSRSEAGSISDHARRLGLDRALLANLLREKGLIGDTRKTPTLRPRLTNEVVDKAVAGLRHLQPGMTVAAHARRLGVATSSINAWLRKAGTLALGQRRLHVRYTAEVVDAARVAHARRRRVAA